MLFRSNCRFRFFILKNVFSEMLDKGIISGEANQRNVAVGYLNRDELSDELDPFYYSNYACRKVIEDKAIQFKIANDPLMLADGIDYNFVVAVRELLTGYKENHSRG